MGHPDLGVRRPGEPAGPPAAVYIEVVAAPATTTTAPAPTTTTSSTTTTVPLRAPAADGSFVFNNLGIPVGSRIFYSYTLTNSVGSTSELVDFNGA